MKHQARKDQKNDETATPPYLEIPVDEDDPRYSRSFGAESADDLDAAKDFFEEFGFCVFRDVIGVDQCEATIDDMLALLRERHPGVDARDPCSWATALTNFGCPKGVNAVFRPSLLRLRQNPGVLRALAALLGTPDLIVSHDRWLLHRPPPPGSAPLTRRNLHLDMNPWEYQDEGSRAAVLGRLSRLRYGSNDRSYVAENNDVHSSMGRSVQAILNLRDVDDRQKGGTVVIPGSHRTFNAWVRHRAGPKAREGPMQYVLDGSDRLLGRVQHPTLRAGSLIVWDQRLFHGSTPNLSSHMRVAVPVKAFEASVLRQDKRRRANEVLPFEKQFSKHNSKEKSPTKAERPLV